MDRDVLHSMISWFIRGILYFPSVFLVFSLLSISFQVHNVFMWSFPGDVVNAGKFVFLGFNMFFQLRSRTVLLLNSSRLSHYTVPILNPGHFQYGCALYVRRSIQTTYVRRQDHIEQIGDMLDSAMHQANVARRQKITAPLPADSKKLWVSKNRLSFISLSWIK